MDVKSKATFEARRRVRYKDGYKNQLASKFLAVIEFDTQRPIATRYIKLDPLANSGKALMIISPGYAWDGCSGPTWDTNSAVRACLIHDALYQLGREGRFGALPDWRAAADQVLRRAAVADGMWRWRAWAWYRMVRRFGGRHNAKARPVKVAP